LVTSVKSGKSGNLAIQLHNSKVTH